jgi:hypothetical protein
MLPAVPAHTAVDVRGVGTVLQVLAAGCRQGGVQLHRPFLVRFGETPHLLRCQAEISDQSLKRSARIDAIEKPLSDYGGEPCLRFGSLAASFSVSVCLTARGASTAALPSRVRAMP